METLFEAQVLERLSQFTLDRLMRSATLNFYVFTLVVTRLSGLVVAAPLFDRSVLPARVRFFVTFAVALVVAPVLASQQSASLEMPAGLPEYTLVILAEFSFGAVLGVGVLIVLSGLQLAGQLIDRQVGLALADVFSPDASASPPSTRFLYLFGAVVLLTMQPINGHVLMFAALLDTFRGVPAGEALVSLSQVAVLSDLVQQSLRLALRVAAPVLAAMSLVSLTVGYLGRSAPQINFLTVGIPVRIFVALLLLSASLSNVAVVTAEAVENSIDALSVSMLPGP